MFRYIFLNELKYWLKKPAIYIYILFFSGIAFIGFVGTAGLFDSPTTQKLTRLSNSPFEINYMMQYFNKFFLFLLPAIIGATIYRDYKDNAHSVLYSYPIKKKDYLFSKFLSSFLLVCFITLCVGIALLIAEHIPGLDTNKIGPFNLLGYIQVFLVYTIPNMLFFGAIVFATVSYFRNIYAGFVVIIILFLIQNITQNLFSGYLIALLDPFGQNATIYETQYWTLQDKNTKLIPTIGAVLFNRLLWFTIASFIYIYVYKKFAFIELPIQTFSLKRNKAKRQKKTFKNHINMSLPKVNYVFSIKQHLINCWKLSHVNFLFIIKNWMFYIIVVLGLLSVLFTIGRVTNNEEITILPVTNIVLTIPAFFFTTIIMLLTFIYSGMLIHRDRTCNINQLIDTTATTNWTLLLSRVIAILKMQLFLLLIMMAAGIIIQLFNNYHNLEIGLYFVDLFAIKFIGLLIWAFVSVLVHTVFKNTYLGIFILLIGWFGISGIKQIGIDSRLLLFNFTEPMQYSDVNKYGDQLIPYFLVKLYWFAFSSLCLVVTYFLWNRGFVESFKERLQFIKSRLSTSIKIITSLLLITFVISGFTIYTEEQKNDELSSSERNKAFSKFEKDYAKYKSIENQPKITNIDLNISIFPKPNDLLVKGNYTLVNKSLIPIDTLLIKTGFDETTTFKLDKASSVIDEDTYVKFTVLKLEESLLPNDSIQLEFSIKNKPKTLFENHTNILNNGTFFKNDIFPRIGYFLNSGNKHPNDSTAHYYHYYSKDSDQINLNTIISTSNNQVAIAPGYLKKQWEKNNRNYFEYKTDSKIKNSLSFSSGNYEVLKEHYKNINLEIYHHNTHTYNLNQMKAGLKAAIDYNTNHFGAYQFNEARIIEFPITEGTFASVMANSIPTSEMRFIANNSNETIDISFYTIAHELTHQWFGNQIVPADALGAVMLSESITEYISLNIYGNKYGKEKALDFLKMQHKRYLSGRTQEQKQETPLYLVKSGQQYLAYGKGSIAFNTLSHYIGINKMHDILKSFLNDYKFKEAPYPTSINFLNRIKKETPNTLHYLIEDYFETITFHDTKINTVNVITAHESYNTSINFQYSKSRVHDKSVLKLNDTIEIGFYNSQNKLISIKTILISKKDNTKTFNLKEKPTKVVIDPNYLLIEKDRNDNEYNL
ncbi:M1 family aminopeptidase [uncultured Lacinutrix sp.]|uniref:ABC transporter permease/M1 family aminopeptidase n=1 Tax=uncultured Lacinutrix sp. TaxID=574032 RepID=UPI0026154172|nr:M1 family aminopeptidase [uncultured Lacinutrix sp.]